MSHMFVPLDYPWEAALKSTKAQLAIKIKREKEEEGEGGGGCGGRGFTM